mmetsp:Transcript_24662/g.82931  ORF Transcript_24662/g.82931 Transcript_24662/m.82931 type:complete len:230 (-) Transcript_24662:223-912(-)
MPPRRSWSSAVVRARLAGLAEVAGFLRRMAGRTAVGLEYESPGRARGRVHSRVFFQRGPLDAPCEPDRLQPLNALRAQFARLVRCPLRVDPLPQLGAVGCRETLRHGAVAVRRVIGCQQLEVRVPFVSLRVPDERDRLQPLRALRIKLARFVRVPLPVDPAPQHGAVGCGEMVRHGAVAVRRAIGCQQLEVRVPGVSEHLPEKTGRLQPLDALRAQLARLVCFSLRSDP